MNKQPSFKKVFGDQWAQMPPVLRDRYANRACCKDQVVVDGVLNVYVSRWMKLLSPMLRLCGALLPYPGRDIPVQVCFDSQPDSDTVEFNRTFHFHDRAPYQFRSRLVPIGGDQVVEFMRFGLGWRMRLYYDGDKVVLAHDGYIWKIGGVSLPLPMGIVLGKGYAYEKATSDKDFEMYFEIIHPLFGKVFGYDGRFTVSKLPQ